MHTRSSENTAGELCNCITMYWLLDWSWAICYWYYQGVFNQILTVGNIAE